jgi:polar amino acid transport system substrate-binding protein
VNQRRRLVIALGAGALTAPFASLAQQQGKVWRIGYPPFGAPLYSLPGATPETYRTLDADAAQGAMIDLFRAIAMDAGVQAQFLAFVAGEMDDAIRSSKIDIRAAVISPENQKWMDISEPIFNAGEVLIANKIDTTSYASYGDLKGQVVGSRTGTVSEADLKANGFEVKSYATAPELYKAVDIREVNVAINTQFIPTAYALMRDDYPNVKIVKTYQQKLLTVIGIGVRKNGGALLGTIRASLAKLKTDGTVKAIFAQYGIADALTN